ncbi:MAG TPA: type II toxin-antitoxin system VapC family toxin [Terriglobales bacterium]|nr:type II toxin-antitoxin system VapC family toxin [Terriglobales bacterium]
MIVLDTSFLLGLVNQQDVHHEAARRLQSELRSGRWGQGALLEYVMVELMNMMVKRRGAEHAARTGRYLLGSDLHFVACSPLFGSAFVACCAQSGTRAGLVDMAIATYARAHADGQVATFDRELARLPGIIAVPAEGA